MATHIHNVYLLIQLTLEQHRFELWGHPHRQIFLFSKYSTARSMVCWILRCRNWDMEGWLWDFITHRFVYRQWVLEPGMTVLSQIIEKIIEHTAPFSSLLSCWIFPSGLRWAIHSTRNPLGAASGACPGSPSSSHLPPFLVSAPGVSIMWINSQLLEDGSRVTH